MFQFLLCHGRRCTHLCLETSGGPSIRGRPVLPEAAAESNHAVAAGAPCGLLFSASQPKVVQPRRWSIPDKVCTSWSWTPSRSPMYSPLVHLIHKLLDNLLDLCSSRNARWYAHPSLTLCATAGFLRFFLIVHILGMVEALSSYIFYLGSAIALVHYIH